MNNTGNELLPPIRGAIPKAPEFTQDQMNLQPGSTYQESRSTLQKSQMFVNRGHLQSGSKVQPSSNTTLTADESQIEALKKSYGLERTQFSTSEEYINKLRFSIGLDSLYQVVDSCCSNQEAPFCPVLVEIGKKLEDRIRDGNKYLLQVWSRKGKLIFERGLSQSIINWNLHENYFVFQEYNKEIYMVELSEANEQKLHSLMLPFSDESAERDIEGKQVSGALNQGTDLNKRTDLKGICEQLDVKHIPRKIGIAQDHLIMAKGRKVFYAKIDKVKSETPRTLSKNLEYFQIADNCTVLDIMDIGNGETILVLSNELNKIVFYQIKSFSQDKIVNVQMVKLGLQDHDINSKDGAMPLSQPAQFRAIVMLDKQKVYCDTVSAEKEKSQKKKFTFSAVVTREDRSFEFYSDFNMVSSSKKNDTEFEILQLAVSNDSYLLLVNEKNQDSKVTLYEVSFSWGNLLSMSVATKLHKGNIDDQIAEQKREGRNKDKYGKKLTLEAQLMKARKDITKKIEKKLEAANHRRISPYFRIFTQFYNYDTYMLVAHREYISVFDLKDNGSVKNHIAFDDQVILIADTKSKISILLGNNKICTIKKHLDDVKIDEDVLRLPDHIIDFCSDQNKDTAVFFLVKTKTDLQRQSSSDDDLGQWYKTFNQLDHKTRVRRPLELERNFNGEYKIQALFDQEYVDILPKVGAETTLDMNTQIKVFYKQSGKDLVSYLMVQSTEKTYTTQIKIEKNPHSEREKLTTDKVTTFYDELKIDEENPNPAITQLLQRFGDEPMQGRLVGAVTGEGESYGSREGFMAKITTSGIQVYDNNHKMVEFFANPCMQELVLVDETYVYCLCEATDEPMKKYDILKKVVHRPRGASISKQNKGLYVYDIERLLKDGLVENYYLAPSAVGMAHQLDLSDSSGRLSYFTNFREISMLPFPHRNTINFLGMGKKEEYLIWRESDGFFTALHRNGDLRIWSVGSGKFVGLKPYKQISEKGQSQKMSVEDLDQNYEIYKAHVDDTCYTKNFKNDKNHTLQLFKKREPQRNPVIDQDKVRDHNFEGRSVNCINAEQDVFEFLVVKLTTGTDKKKQKEMHGIGAIGKRKVEAAQAELKVSIKMRFELKLPKDNQYPTLHLSKDRKKLMEVSNRQVAVIYKRDKDRSGGSIVTWKVKNLISQYPTLLQGHSTLPFLFDPNFKRYIDVDYSKGNFVIRSVNPQKHKTIEIPKHLLPLSSTVDNENESGKELVIKNEESISLIAKRMHFCKKNMIRIINSEGIDTLYDFTTRKILVYSKRDNFLKVQKRPSKSTKHLFLEPEDFDVNDVISRLVHRTQSYKGALEFAKYELNCRLAEGKYHRKPNIFTYLYKVEYRPDNFVAEASFTLLDWIICERIQKDSLFDLNDIDRQQQIQLCFNIFPKAKTIMHMLAYSENQENVSEQSESIGNISQKLFSVCKNGLPLEYKNFKKKIGFELPIIEDMNGHTVLDIALEKHDFKQHKDVYSKFWKIIELVFFTKQPTIFKESENIRSKAKLIRNELQDNHTYRMPQLNSQLAMTIFANIENYSYLHSSSIICRAVIEAINVGLPNIGEYLDKRLVESQHMPNKTQHDLLWNLLSWKRYCHTGAQYCDQDEPGSEDKWLNQSYRTEFAQLWENKKELEVKLFKQSGVHKNMIIRYLDVPLLHTKQSEGIAFMRAMRNLSRSAAEDIQMNIYGKRSVQIVINEHWDRTYFYLSLFLFFPYMCMLAIYTIWANFTLQGTLEWAVQADETLQNFLVAFSCYFLFFEMVQFVTQPWQYFLEGWSYIKTIPMALVLWNSTVSVENRTSLSFWQSQAICGFCMWMRLLYYMRSIEAFSYFIRMLMQVVWKIRIFIIILLIAVFGFADTFYSLSTSTIYMAPYVNADGEDAQRPSYITNYINSLQYSYQIVIGQFADDLNDQDTMSWFFFILASIISMLVLANLLIEIVAETYGEVTSRKYLFVFKERVDLICDWQTVVFVVMGFCEFLYMIFIKPILYCFSKMKFRNKHAATIEKTLQKMTNNCELLMVAWEDPENKDSTNDFVEDENEETTDEKIDLVKNTLNDMKLQLGLDLEPQDDFDASVVQNPIQSIQLIHDKVKSVIEQLGLNTSEANNQDFGSQHTYSYQDKESQPRASHRQEISPHSGIKYKKDEYFDWQAKRN